MRTKFYLSLGGVIQNCNWASSDEDTFPALILPLIPSLILIWRFYKRYLKNPLEEWCLSAVLGYTCNDLLPCHLGKKITHKNCISLMHPFHISCLILKNQGWTDFAMREPDISVKGNCYLFFMKSLCPLLRWGFQWNKVSGSQTFSREFSWLQEAPWLWYVLKFAIT